LLDFAGKDRAFSLSCQQKISFFLWERFRKRFQNLQTFEKHFFHFAVTSSFPLKCHPEKQSLTSFQLNLSLIN